MTKKCTVTCLLMLIVLSSANPTNAFYDYQTGRWLNQDPIGYQDSINLYDYVGSNPVNVTDPSGLWGLCFWGHCIGDADYPSLAFGGEQFYDPEYPKNEMSLLDILLSIVRGRAGGQVSETICTPLGIGKGCVTLNGVIWWNDCCAGELLGGQCMGEMSQVICFRGAVEFYYHLGTPTRTDEADDELVPWEVMAPMEEGGSIRDSHFQQTGGFGGVGKLNTCQPDLYDLDVKLMGFIRGAAGIGVIGVRGTANLEIFSLDEGFPTSWEEIEENTDFRAEAASGIYGASIEAGVSGTIDICVLLGDLT